MNSEYQPTYTQDIQVKQPDDIPYELNLLYRASRDDNTAAAFHSKCNNKGPIIVVIKVTNSSQIIEGYNPLSLDSAKNDKSTKDSFIFTDENELQSL
ncbi:hypothetical protein RclHR1_21010003 [Rhizophagus clarus]|uniref:TLDc domain-containing protein n=1 Tax=Rhizophagus clarus TaxID=94130 RepID=A0A2Z6QU95_9GLOM|nr:hypothetical protein RclHR1_21010003 [Rhizophagus clarus]